MTLMMTFAQVVETSVSVTNNSDQGDVTVELRRLLPLPVNSSVVGSRSSLENDHLTLLFCSGRHRNEPNCILQGHFHRGSLTINKLFNAVQQDALVEVKFPVKRTSLGQSHTHC